MILHTDHPSSSQEEAFFNQLKPTILDPLGRDLAKHVSWINLKIINNSINADEIETDTTFSFPIALIGKGSPVILLHGFDSSFLEFRRLVPLLEKHFQLIIPDLYGFGFGPRPLYSEYGMESILCHLGEILSHVIKQKSVSVIGASMGGAMAIELARKFPTRIDRLLLLSPAGLIGKKNPLISPFDKLGVWILSLPIVRRNLCRQAFAHPGFSVGPAEEQIASLHLSVPGWSRSLAAFARSGGVAGCGEPLPTQPINVIWGENDRILNKSIREESSKLFDFKTYELPECGHLPHLDCPEMVADMWLKVAKG